MNNLPINTSEEPASFNPKQILHLLVKNWYWYVLSLLLCLTCAWVYLRYTTPVYTVTTTLLLKENNSKKGNAENFLDGLDLVSSSRNVLNEMELIRSFNNIEQTIRELNLDISYFEQGNIKAVDIYGYNPFQVNLDTNFKQRKNVPIYVKILSDSTFSIGTSKENTEEHSSKSDKTYKFGEYCHSDDYSFIINKTGFFTFDLNKKSDYFFVIQSVEGLCQAYISKLKLELSDKKSSVLILSLIGSIPEKDVNFLNKLTEVYIEAGIKEKNQTAVNMIHFIDDHLNQITDSLKGAENHLEKFRSKEKIMDLGTSASNAFTQLEELEKGHAGLIVKDRYYQYLLNYLSYNYDIQKIIAPSAMGIDDPQLNNLIAELHALNTEKTSLSFSTQAENPTIHVLDLKVENTKKTLIETLKNIMKASDIALQDNQERLKRIQQLVDKLPSSERSLVNIQRRFLLNESIYNYLMQKRIEAGIAKASNISDSKVINKARLSQKRSIAPKRNIIMLIGLILGLIIPSASILIKFFLNDKITNQETIEHYISAPIIGSIPHNPLKRKDQLPIISSPKSGVSESIRSLRINLQYLAADKRNKVIGITSSVSGEGKTFFSSNIAASIALSGAKVIVIGADLRKPKLNQLFEVNNDLGLSNYYINKAELKDIIKKTAISNLDIITSGPIPPNPTELLESAKTDVLFSFLKENYEYIIVDAPPVGLVADYYLLSKYIDADLYLIRQNHTPKALLKDINMLYKTQKLANMFIVFNDASNNSAYGYGYGYSYHGYYEEAEHQSGITAFLSALKKSITRS